MVKLETIFDIVYNTPFERILKMNIKTAKFYSCFVQFTLLIIQDYNVQSFNVYFSYPLLISVGSSV